MTLRAGLVGLGMMGRNHARVLSQLEGVELVAIADPHGDAHRAPRGIPLVGSVDELLELRLDYCVLAAPTVLHETIGERLAAAGVPTLIEKPLAATVSGARRVVAAFGERGLVAGVGHVERYNPALQHLRARLAEGEVGAVYQVATRRQGPFPARISDVGVVKDLATHDIDLTAWVTQRPFLAVSARVAHKSGREHEDLVAAIGQLTDGVVSCHLVNWLSPMKERMTVVTGERGTFVADTLTADLTFFANGTVATEWDSIAKFRGVTEGDMVRFAIPKPEPLVTEHEAFRDAVLGKEADIVTLEQGLHNVVVAEALLESAERGETVQLRATQDPPARAVS